MSRLVLAVLLCLAALGAGACAPSARPPIGPDPTAAASNIAAARDRVRAPVGELASAVEVVHGALAAVRGEPAGEFEARLRAVRALLSETLDRLDDASEAAAALDLGASTAAVEIAERAYDEVLRRVQAGEQVEIVKSGVPVAVRRA